MRDPYVILGVSRKAGSKEIKSAFRNLAKKYHPDHNADNPQARERFSEISQAYEILGDEERRSRFDQGEIDAEGKPVFQDFHRGRSNPFGGASGQGRNGWNQSRSQGAFRMDDVLFRNFFGREAPSFDSRSSGTRSDTGLAASVEISLEQSVGAEKIEVVFENGRKLRVKLPTFFEDGQVIRLKGQGGPGPDGANRDALVTLRLKPHLRFRLDGRALHLDFPVSLKTAVLGARREVETLDRVVAINIPSWSGSDRVLRLKDKGLSLKAGGRAPLYVHIRVMLPKDPDPDLEALVRKYQESP